MPGTIQTGRRQTSLLQELLPKTQKAKRQILILKKLVIELEAFLLSCFYVF